MSNDDLPELNWESANVSEETLTVELDGERPKHWGEVFAQTVRLLPGGEWDDVKCKKAKVTVTGVRAGVEDRLVHFLESVVQQVNATFASADEHDDDDGEDDAQQHTDAAEDPKEDPDAELTARFRAFGQ